jgi:excinuclease UvrABC nuclease subunit
MGKKNKVTKKIEKKMKLASKNLEFEKALELKQQLEAINIITHPASQVSWEEPFKVSDDERIKARIQLYKTLSPLFATRNDKTPIQPFERIEAYDVSNIFGKHATGAMVVFTNGDPDPDQYRRFRIRWSNKAGDTTMIYEILSRRAKHLEWKLPNLIIIDGGKGQVKAAKKALATRGLHNKIPVVGLAKSFDYLVIHKNIFHVIRFPKNSPALKLIIHIRDEAHRFAKGYHKVLRKKALIS